VHNLPKMTPSRPGRDVEAGRANSEDREPAASPAGSDLEPASLARLWLAAFLDAAVGLSLWAVCAMALLKVLNYPETPFTLPGGILAALVALAVLLHLAYHVFCIGRFGQTLGKDAMGIAVVKRDGARAGYSRALLRSLGGMASVLTLGLANLGVLVNRDRRGAGDWLAGTRIVRVPRA
jgi:uncharacterized RDD family membrane protein YckC